MNKKSLLLYCVTDRKMANGKLEQVVETAVQNGVSMVQLREKEATFEDFCNKAFAMKKICDKYQVPLIINDSVEVCKAVNASGVHLGGSDCDLKKARQELPNKIIGASARDVATAKLAEQNGADYLGVGAVFGTSTKKDAKTISVPILCEIANSVKLPVVAIGGVNLNNVEQLANSGIAGVAVVSEIMKAKNVDTVCKEFLQKLKKIVD